MEDTRVVILAGGTGSRLRPYTTVLPKPLMPIGEHPILGVVLRQLRYYGFKRITLSVNHLSALIMNFFGDGSELGLEITYCTEDEPLGTAGSLSLVEDTTEHFLVMNGDLLTTISYRELMNHHIASEAIATIGVYPREVTIDFGVLDLDDRGDLLAYREKPRFEYTVSMGVNAFHRSALEFIPKDQYLDIPTLMMRLKDAGRRVGSFRSECEWLDIGRPSDYEAAVEAFEANRGKYLKPTPSPEPAR